MLAAERPARLEPPEHGGGVIGAALGRDLRLTSTLAALAAAALAAAALAAALATALAALVALAGGGRGAAGRRRAGRRRQRQVGLHEADVD